MLGRVRYCICLVFWIDQREVRFYLNGVDVSQLNDVDASRMRNAAIGLCVQMHNLLPEFSALEK